MKPLRTIGSSIAAASFLFAAVSPALSAGQKYIGGAPYAKPIYASDGIYLALPARTIPTTGVESLTWSNDGKSLLMIRRPATPEILTVDDAIASIVPRNMQSQPVDFGTEIDSFDVATGAMKAIWHGDVEGLNVSTVAPIGQLGAFVIVLSKSDESLTFHYKLSGNGPDRSYEMPGLRSWVMIVDAGTSKWKFVPRFENRVGGIGALVSPLEPKALLTVESASSVTTKDGSAPSLDGPGAAMIDVSGNSIQTWNQSFLRPNWMADGKSFFWLVSVKDRKATFATFGSDGQPANLTVRPAAYQPPADNPPIIPVEVPFRPGDQLHNGRVTGLYLHVRGGKSGKDVLLAPGGKEAALNPTQDAVLFKLGSDYKSVRILKAPPESLAALRKALKTQALSFAKQAGLAAIMYSGDNDDKYPDGKDSMTPYLKNDEILDFFNYSLSPNLDATSISSPAETVMGYVDGPGGRAVVYTDGHAKWINDPEP